MVDNLIYVGNFKLLGVPNYICNVIFVKIASLKLSYLLYWLIVLGGVEIKRRMDHIHIFFGHYICNLVPIHGDLELSAINYGNIILDTSAAV